MAYQLIHVAYGLLKIIFSECKMENSFKKNTSESVFKRLRGGILLHYKVYQTAIN